MALDLTRVRIHPGFQRTLQLRHGEVVGILGVGVHTRKLRAHVVGPALCDIATRTDECTERCVVELGLATTAFDIAAPDVQRHGAIRIRGGAADRSELLRAQERIVAVDRGEIEEAAAGRDLRDRAVVGEHQLRVDVGERRQLIVSHRAQAVARSGTQIEVLRAEVVLIRGIDERAEVARALVHGEVEGWPRSAGVPAEIGERAGECRARTAASERRRRVGGERARRVVAVALQNLFTVLVGRVRRDIAAAVFSADAHRQGRLNFVAIGHVVIRQRELRRVGLGTLSDDVAQRDCARTAEIVVVLIEVVLKVDLHTLEVLLHDEVDDAGDRVRTVDSRGAAREDFDALDHCGRDLVQVGCGVRDTAVRHTTAIDEHQGARRAETTQVHCRGAGCAVRDRCVLSGERLR